MQLCTPMPDGVRKKPVDNEVCRTKAKFFRTQCLI